MDKKQLDLNWRKDKFSIIVIKWSKKNLRSFPWRKNISPYEVFISEILLKRTTTKAVERVYGTFLEEFQDIESIAAADITDLERVLHPIGIYNERAKGLKEAAKYILEHSRGEICSEYESLLQVPHIGPYTAGAILSFAYGKPIPIVDSNVKRVVSRVFSDNLGNRPSDKEVKDFLLDIVPKKEHKLFNWGLIDLGSILCSYNFIKCKKCPLTQICYHYQRSI